MCFDQYSTDFKYYSLFNSTPDPPSFVPKEFLNYVIGNIGISKFSSYGLIDMMP